MSLLRDLALCVARRVTVLLILRLLLSDGVSTLTDDVLNYGLFDKMRIFFSSPDSIGLFVHIVLSTLLFSDKKQHQLQKRI